MKNNKILGLIGLAAKARNVAYGADSVETEIKKKKVKLIVVADLASDRTKEKFKKLSKDFEIPIIIDGTIEEISKAIGKENKAIIGVKDINISKQIEKINNGGDVIG